MIISKQLLFIAFSVFLLVPSHTQESETLIQESWDLIKMAGSNAGWSCTKTSKIVKADDKVFYKTETSAHMEIKRLGQTITIESKDEIIEDSKGRIISASRRTDMSGNETLFKLIVKGMEATLTITTMGKPRESSIEWAENVIGPYGASLLKEEQGIEPNKTYSLKTYIFDLPNRPLTATFEIKGLVETELLHGKKAKLCHVLSGSDFMPNVKQNEWWNENYDPIKTKVSMMGFTIESFRTTKEEALSATGGELKSDLLIESMAQSNITIPRPYRLDSILYRFESKDKELGIPEGLDDLRQKVLENDGQTAKVLIKTVAPTSHQKFPLENPSEDLMEYLNPCAFIQSEHPGLKDKALEVIAGETDAWKAAQKLEHFVFKHISDKNFGTGFASAGEVFERKTGDCSEHGVLLAALCRAVGIPSRVTMGYMYLGGIFGGHMWAEVWINGDWYALDGVMGIGRVDPTHIRFSTTSLAKGGMGESFAQAISGLGNLKISVLELTQGNQTIVVGENFKDYQIAGDTYTNLLYGVSITKPENYTFKNYDRDFSGISFTLLKLKGDPDIKLKALPAVFSYTMDNYRKQILGSRGAKIISEISRNVHGRPGRIFMVKTGESLKRHLAIITNDTCYVLTMRVKNEEEDIVCFEKTVNSIRFLD